MHSAGVKFAPFSSLSYTPKPLLEKGANLTFAVHSEWLFSVNFFFDYEVKIVPFHIKIRLGKSLISFYHVKLMWYCWILPEHVNVQGMLLWALCRRQLYLFHKIQPCITEFRLIYAEIIRSNHLWHSHVVVHLLFLPHFLFYRAQTICGQLMDMKSKPSHLESTYMVL